jgi:hypothetical protein
MEGIMFRTIFTILILILSVNYQIQAQINDYPISKIKVISVGKEDGLIGWESPVAGGYSKPRTMVISRENMVYVPDGANNRINLYDLSLNYVKSIKEEGKRTFIDKSQTLMIDEHGSMYYSFPDSGLFKLDKGGKRIYYIDAHDLPKNVIYKNALFLIDDEAYYYGDDDKIRLIAKDGALEDTESAFARLEEHSINNKMKTTSIDPQIELTSEKKKIFTDIRKEKHYILTDDCAYISDAKRAREYFKQIRTVRDYVYKSESNKPDNTQYDELPTNTSFISYDDDHNGYWMGEVMDGKGAFEYYILVYSKYGEFLDAFYYGAQKYVKQNNQTFIERDARYPTTGAIITIAPSGDVYFLMGNEKEYTFYKVTRSW